MKKVLIKCLCGDYTYFIKFKALFLEVSWLRQLRK